MSKSLSAATVSKGMSAPRKTSASTTGSNGSQNPSTTGQSGLSIGAQAGIGVGVAVVALILVGACLVSFRRRHRHSKSMKRTTNGRPYVDAKAELDESSRAATKTSG